MRYILKDVYIPTSMSMHISECLSDNLPHMYHEQMELQKDN